jgi:dTDP-4-amino-4,6-dideoxygalactose transaminase
MGNVLLVDLKAQYDSIHDEIDAAIRDVIERSAFIRSADVRSFESEFAAYCEVADCVGVGNGTDALYLALRAFGIGAGDEVITVAHTFIATAEAITATGARPRFVDVLPDTLLMNPEELAAAITPHTRAVIPVHLYGQPCDMTAIMAVARRHGLKVIEDAAQAHGARWRNRRVGSLGDAACFSFYPGKNLGAYGDGGAVVSNDVDLIRRVRMFANHGRLEKYAHELPGINSRLDGLQSAILRVKLRHLDHWNMARRRHAAEYLKILFHAGIGLPVTHPDAESVWHLFVVSVLERDRMQRRLKDRGIETGVHYPIPLHLQPAYKPLGISAGTLPVTELAAQRVLSLPMYAELTQRQMGDICQAMVEAVRS